MDTARYREFLDRGGVADLSDRVRLRLTGADRVRYLNGQVSANVGKLTPDCAIPACVTTAKGKLCAEIMIAAEEDALFIDADAALAGALPARLERYIIADDVEIVPAPEGERLLHFIGIDPAALGGVKTVRAARRFGRDGQDVCIADPVLTGLPMLDADLLETLRVEAGVPRWGRELDESTLPPEVGLERTHIDFHKGCYVGQEVISRLKSVGHVNRQLTGFVSSGGAALTAGDEIFAGADREKSVGRLTSVAWSFALEKPVALGYLKRGAPTGGLIAAAPDSSRPPVSIAVHDLPFTP